MFVLKQLGRSAERFKASVRKLAAETKAFGWRQQSPNCFLLRSTACLERLACVLELSGALVSSDSGTVQ